MDYSTLVAAETTVGSIKYTVNYSRIDASGILTEAQEWIYARLRVRQMIAADDVAISSAATTATLPTGYLDPIHFCIPGYVNRIVFRDPESFRTMLGWDDSAVLPEGPPVLWTEIGEVAQLSHKADQAYTAKMVFFKEPTALSGANETNWLTDKYPTLLRRACLMFASEARKEYDQMDRSEIKALEMIDEIKRESDLHMRGMELDFGWDGTN